MSDSRGTTSTRYEQYDNTLTSTRVAHTRAEPPGLGINSGT
jgi:hypothetical protein